ncbi:MAG: tetratricopeptide repeat protein [Rubrobacteridae bacterium]|nr:tetratricopeptide repeat protein [Rubrobacteridae bacterium]
MILLMELDKIKTSRADRELRYRGREISRILFDLSDNGKLTEGIPFGKNSLLQVVSYSPPKVKNDQLSVKNSDDRILLIVNQLKTDSNGRPVTIVTNDLNMLLKAQTFGFEVEHPGKEFAYSGLRRIAVAAQTKQKSVGTILAIAITVVLVLYVMKNPQTLGLQPPASTPPGPPALVKKFQDYQNQVRVLETQRETYEAILKKKPKDLQALIGIGNVYLDLGDSNDDPSTSPKYYKKAIENYEIALSVDPDQKAVRTNMGVAYYLVGITDRAISELNKVIKQDSSFYQAYYHLGVVQIQSQNDPEAAKPNFEMVLRLAPRTSDFAMRANSFIQQINAQINMNNQTKTE